MSLFFVSFLTWVTTLISSVTFILILLGVNPFQASIGFQILFFGFLFLALGGILSLVGFYLREFLTQQSKLSTLVSALRQGFLFSILIVSILIMYATETFAIWQALMLTAVVILLEVYFR